MNFIYYADLAEKIFNYLNGKINRYTTNIHFQINDSIPGYGELCMRSILNLNLPRILNTLNDKSKIETNILFVICHELYHADQEVIDQDYLTSEEYQKRKEAETNYRAITYILENAIILQNEFNIDISIEDLLFVKDRINNVFGLGNIGDYRRYTEYEIVDKLIQSITRTKIEWQQYPNVLLSFRYPFGGCILSCIKDNGHLNSYCIYELQNIIIDFSRFVKLDTTTVYTESENAFVIKVNIVETINGIEFGNSILQQDQQLSTN